jgi:hypothetical protein
MPDRYPCRDEQMDASLASEDDSNLWFFSFDVAMVPFAAMEDGPFLLSCLANFSRASRDEHCSQSSRSIGFRSQSNVYLGAYIANQWIFAT